MGDLTNQSHSNTVIKLLAATPDKVSFFTEVRNLILSTWITIILIILDGLTVGFDL